MQQIKRPKQKGLSTESAIELQKFDCNCSDCKHLLRNNYRKQIEDEWRRKLDFEEWNKQREADLFVALTLLDKTMLYEITNRRFLPRKPQMAFGYCKLFELKEISFLPGVLQLETQQCFEHRRN